MTTDSYDLRVCVLASGSSGNCIYVESPTTAILLDAGLSARQTLLRLNRAGLDPDKLRAICISHEHSDHSTGVARLHKKYGWELYANSDTARAVDRAGLLSWNLFRSGSPFAIGDIDILPFSLPHDAYDPVGFVLRRGNARIGVATDLGIPTQLARQQLRGCQLVILEANHDEMLLQSSPRPWALKQRIRSHQGHLSNMAAAEMLVDIAGDTLQKVFLAHLSRECNDLGLALRTVRRHLAEAGLDHIHVLPTHPDRHSEFAHC